MFRQGDVLIIPVEQVPDGATPIARERGRLVLAHGEATGHAHVVEGPAEFLSSDVEEMERRFLRAESDVLVVHDEHVSVALPPGDYEVRGQREYSPEEIRRVAD